MNQTIARHRAVTCFNNYMYFDMILILTAGDDHQHVGFSVADDFLSKQIRASVLDHEDKVAWLSAEHSEQETHIRHLQKDLESARADTIRVEGEVAALSEENDNIFKLIISRQNELETLEANSRTLSQASELLNENVRKKSSHTLESKSSYENLQAEARSQLNIFQGQCESLKRATEETNASLAEATKKAPVTAPQPSLVYKDEDDQGKITDDFEMVEADNDMVGARLRLERLQEEAKQAEEDLRKIYAEHDQLEAGFGALEESFRELTEEKFCEEDYMQTLHDRLQQLKDYCQDVACGSCKHACVIECNGSKFVMRSA